MKRLFTLMFALMAICILNAQIKLKNPTVEMGDYSLDVTLSLTDQNGNVLEPSNLFFCVYTDGATSAYTFSKSIFTYIDEDMTEIPYNYSDSQSYDIWASEGKVSIYSPNDFTKKMGAQAIYHSGTDTYKSDIVWSDGTVTSESESAGEGTQEGGNEEEDMTIVNTTISSPEGVQTVTSRSSYSFYALGSSVFDSNADGTMSNYIIATDGTIYMQATIGGFNIENYIKLEKTENGKYVAKLPQMILIQENEGKEHAFYASRLGKTLDGEGKTTYALHENEANEIKFTLSDGVLSMDEPKDGSIILGMTDAEGAWTGYGDYDIVETPINRQMVTLPEGAEIKTWVLDYKFANDPEQLQKSIKIKGAICGDEIYLSNPYNQNENQWFKGTISGETVTFKTAQMVGADELTNKYLYFATGKLTTEDGMVFLYEDADDIVFTYDAVSHTLSTTENVSMYICQGIGGRKTVVGNYDFPELSEFVEKFEGLQDPAITSLDDYYETVGYSVIQAKIPLSDISDNLLDENKLFYRLLIDGNPFTFTPAAYPSDFTENTTEIPYLHEGYDVYPYEKGSDLRSMIVYFGLEGKKIGIQSIYLLGDGKKAYSNIVWNDGTITGLTELRSTGIDTRGEVYYDLSGRRVNSPTRGNVYIRLSRNSTGSSVKQIVRYY